MDFYKVNRDLHFRYSHITGNENIYTLPTGDVFLVKDKLKYTIEGYVINPISSVDATPISRQQFLATIVDNIELYTEEDDAWEKVAIIFSKLIERL